MLHRRLVCNRQILVQFKINRRKSPRLSVQCQLQQPSHTALVELAICFEDCAVVQLNCKTVERSLSQEAAMTFTVCWRERMINQLQERRLAASVLSVHDK